MAPGGIVGPKPKQVRGVGEGIMGMPSEQFKQNGAFTFAGVLNMQLTKEPVTPARKGVNPFTKDS